MTRKKFMFATGIENSYPTIVMPDGTTKRIDEMEKSGHHLRWKEDFDLVKDLGIEFLRYGPPYYKTHLGPDQYDWTFADETFERLKKLGIHPIVDLCHFGVPDWIGSFQNPEFPQLFAAYAKAFAKRFPYLQFYTPINEIFITATFSAQFGWWNERKTSDLHFVTALKHCCMANTLAMGAILEIQPNATFIQSESSEYFHAKDPSCNALATFYNKKRFLPLDLTYGKEVGASIYEYLIDNGMTRKEYHWFGENAVKAHCIMGNDYYVTNEHMVNPDGSITASGEILGYYVITNQYYSRYRLPVMHTETNRLEPYSVDWLKKEWANVHRLKKDGVPIVGFTWFSLLNQVDWDSALREDKKTENFLGLYDLNRKIQPVGTAYKELILQWKDVITIESYGLHLNDTA
jgi:beta-glucosidase/6-phospho-beta-glucosidase/beta-galactosidase